MKKQDMAAVREKGAANRQAMLANGWPLRPDNQRYFELKPYGRIMTAFVKGKGFWMHLQGDSRVAFAQGYEGALKALIRLLEPEVESIELV